MERRKHVRYLHACGVSSGDIVRIQQGELDEAEAIAAATPRGSRGQTPEAQARRNRVWGRIALGVICLGATLFIPPLVVVMVPLFVVGWFLVNKIMPVELAEHETDRDFRLVYGSQNRLDEERIADLERERVEADQDYIRDLQSRIDEGGSSGGR
ncbi:hypothetical protein [Nocardiopsis gilva]|uniref:hypothetical protein n=1 Tax=Nocardiopsis gilva TaxID=280236 RepID=UPI00034BDF99|nr:hypothetical protein [Nocardiopsis gilva]